MRAACSAFLAAIVCSAAPAEAGEAAATFAVGARVIRSGSVAVAGGTTSAERRLSLRAGRGAPGVGLAVAPESTWRTASVPASALADGVALPQPPPGERVIVTVLLDGHPTAVRFVGRLPAARSGGVGFGR